MLPRPTGLPTLSAGINECLPAATRHAHTVSTCPQASHAGAIVRGPVSDRVLRRPWVTLGRILPKVDGSASRSRNGRRPYGHGERLPCRPNTRFAPAQGSAAHVRPGPEIRRVAGASADAGSVG